MQNEIIKDYQTGISINQCSKKYKKTRETIKRILVKNNITINSNPQKAHSVISEEQIVFLYNQNKTIKDIAKIANIPESQVSKILKKHKIEIIRIPHKLEIPDKDTLLNLYKTKSMLDIAKQYNTTNKTVKNWFNVHKIEIRKFKDTMLLAMEKLAFTKEEYIQKCNYIHNNKYDYSKSDYYRAGEQVDKIEIICPDHGSFYQTPKLHLSGCGCRKCGFSISKGEDELFEFVKENFPDAIQSYKINNKEIDIFIPSLNFGIEYNGLYWHSEKFKEKNYHLNKTKLARNYNISLMHIFEHEWKDKKDIIKSMILSKTKQNKIFYARKCKLIKLTFKQKQDFFNNNHLYGDCVSSICYGLILDNEIVCAMSFGKNRFRKDDSIELIRYASKLNINVVGGASRLLKHFIKENNCKYITSYSDNRYSDGNLYKILRFNYIKDTSVNYFYYNKHKGIVSRISAQKHKLKALLPNFDNNASERENMLTHGYYRVYDCGNKVWELFL